MSKEIQTENKPAETAVPVPVEKVLTDAEKRLADAKALQQKVKEQADELNRKTQERIKVLKENEGKSFKSNAGGISIFKVLRYAGINKLPDGNLAHFFDVSQTNPNNRFTTPATEFLNNHTVFEPEAKSVSEIL